MGNQLLRHGDKPLHQGVDQSKALSARTGFLSLPFGIVDKDNIPIAGVAQLLSTQLAQSNDGDPVQRLASELRPGMRSDQRFLTEFQQRLQKGVRQTTQPL